MAATRVSGPEGLNGSDRLQVGRTILKDHLYRNSQAIFARLAYTPAESAYLQTMVPLLANRAVTEKNGTELSFRNPLDSTQSRRHIILDSQVEGSVGATFRRANDRYSAIHQAEEIGAASIAVASDVDPLMIARFLVIDHQVIDDESLLAEVLKREFAATKIWDSKNRLSGIMRKLHLASTFSTNLTQSGQHQDIETKLELPSGEIRQQRWLEVGSDSYTTILGRSSR